LTKINSFAIRNAISYYEFVILIKFANGHFLYARGFNFWKDFGMPTLQWSDTLALGLPQMDDTHHEFVDLLSQVVSASDEELLKLWRKLIDHSHEHFAREDRWMTDTGFSSTNCHSTQHKVVLEVMREGQKRTDLAIVRQMADELGIWFPQHAQAMDAALALHLRSVGYDPLTGKVNLPQALPEQVIEGCHSAECSSHEAREEHLVSH